MSIIKNFQLCKNTVKRLINIRIIILNTLQEYNIMIHTVYKSSKIELLAQIKRRYYFLYRSPVEKKELYPKEIDPEKTEKKDRAAYNKRFWSRGGIKYITPAV